LPPQVTGAKSCSDLGVEIAGNPHRKDRVYLSVSIEGAMLFAVQAPWREVAIYAVIPWDELEPDPDCNVAGQSLQCKSAKIIHVGRVGHGTRRAWLSDLGLQYIPHSKMPRFQRMVTCPA
jgi:hypothetical protein